MKITREFDEDCHFVGKTRMLICVVSQRTMGPCVSTGQSVVTEQEYRKTYNPYIDIIEIDVCMYAFLFSILRMLV